MIKSDIQVKRAKARLSRIQDELRRLEGKYDGSELDFWAESLREDATKLQDELREYDLLLLLPFQDAVQAILQEPIPLENIGELLTKLRLAAKKTQKEMAKDLGWRQSNLSRFESEKYTSQTIGKISEYIEALKVYLYVRPTLVDQPANVEYESNNSNARRNATSSSYVMPELSRIDSTTITREINVRNIQTTDSESSLADRLFSNVGVEYDSL